jgi:hypothetical protein
MLCPASPAGLKNWMLLDCIKFPQAGPDTAELAKEVPEILGLSSAREFLWEMVW